MLVFLYGSDAYRIKQTKNDFIIRYKSKYTSGVNLFYFNFSEASELGQLEDALRSSSFFSEHKLVVCQNLFAKKNIADRLFEYIKEYNLASANDLTLVVAENLPEKDLSSKHKELFRFLSEKSGTIKNINALDKSKLADWAKKEFEARGCVIQSQALNNLIGITGDDSWPIINEIEKLCAFKRVGEITAADIKLLIAPKIDLNIFDLIDSIAAKNRSKAAELLYRELKSGRDPYYILTMVIYQFRNLLMVKGLQEKNFDQTEIAKKAKLHPFVVKKAVGNLNKFSLNELVNLYGCLLAIDTSSKKGIINLEDSLYKLAI